MKACARKSMCTHWILEARQGSLPWYLVHEIYISREMGPQILLVGELASENWVKLCRRTFTMAWSYIIIIVSKSYRAESKKLALERPRHSVLQH